MGHGDHKQHKLTFDSPLSSRQQPSKTTAEDPARSPTNSITTDVADAIMAELQAGFQVIHTRFNTLGARLDRMDERLDRHATCLEGAECCLSEVEDGSADALKCLETVELMLKTVVDRNGDLEANSRWNNICISGFAETTNMGPSDTFVEKLLTGLFGHLH
ncbi:hypothetical protein NDU88_004267 [Pleurodeles waltl]|uniref:Uncharacterized protein n=1 Tax=Pleurodeles waltl TaxID=8319 RepID=A0AAV7SIE7_PLEWA|nr:hypothetical protein NDU88_004267 [Pleurodeles waltl]